MFRVLLAHPQGAPSCVKDLQLVYTIKEWVFHNTRENQNVKANTFNCFNRSNCEQFYITFFYIVPLQHNAFVISFN